MDSTEKSPVEGHQKKSLKHMIEMPIAQGNQDQISNFFWLLLSHNL